MLEAPFKVSKQIYIAIFTSLVFTIVSEWVAIFKDTMEKVFHTKTDTTEAKIAGAMVKTTAIGIIYFAFLRSRI